MILFVGSWKKIIEAAERRTVEPGFSLEEQADRYLLRLKTTDGLAQGWQVKVDGAHLVVTGESRSRASVGRGFDYRRSYPVTERFVLPPDADPASVMSNAEDDGLRIEIRRR